MYLKYTPPTLDLQFNLICVPSKRMRYFSTQNYYDVTAHRCVRTYLRRCAMWGSRVRCASARTAAVVGRAPSSWFGRECDQSSGSASRSAGTCRPSSVARALSICTAAAQQHLQIQFVRPSLFAKLLNQNLSASRDGDIEGCTKTSVSCGKTHVQRYIIL